MSDSVPKTAAEGGEEEELDGDAYGTDLGRFLGGAEAFNDNSPEAERVMEESLDRDLGWIRRRLAGWLDDPDLFLRASDLLNPGVRKQLAIRPE